MARLIIRRIRPSRISRKTQTTSSLVTKTVLLPTRASKYDSRKIVFKTIRSRAQIDSTRRSVYSFRWPFSSCARTRASTNLFALPFARPERTGGCPSKKKIKHHVRLRDRSTLAKGAG